MDSNPFEHLIPNAPQAAAPVAGNPFEHLIPGAQQSAPLAISAPPPGSDTEEALRQINSGMMQPASHSFGLEDTWPIKLAKSIYKAVTLPGDVYSGNAAVPQSANMPGGEDTSSIGRVTDLASVGSPLSAGGMPSRMVMQRAPTEAALEESKTAHYQSPAIMNLRLHDFAGADLANIIRTDLKSAKVDKFNGGAHYDIADRLEKPRFGDHLTIDDLDAARQDAVINPATATAADKRASKVVRDAIDNYLGNIPQSHVLSGDAAAANKELLAARSDTAALKRSQEISAALGRAENQAGSTYSGFNLDNATRQQLRPILNQKEGVSKARGFQDYTPEEIAALKDEVGGSFVRNKAREFGKKLGGGGGIAHSMIGTGTAGVAHMLGMDPYTATIFGLGVAGAGHGLTNFANRLTAGGGERLGELLRSRSDLGQSGSFPAMAPGQPYGLLPRRAPSLAVPMVNGISGLPWLAPLLNGPQQ
jgi:hypothetical protein